MPDSTAQRPMDALEQHFGGDLPAAIEAVRSGAIAFELADGPLEDLQGAERERAMKPLRITFTQQPGFGRCRGAAAKASVAPRAGHPCRQPGRPVSDTWPPDGLWADCGADMVPT
jgi:hypothetical protein